MLSYGGGLRLNEACHLRVGDLQSGRHQIRVVQGKGRKDRYTLLSPRLLEELRRYWPSLNCTLLACVSADGLARVKFAGPEAFWRCC